MKENPVLQMQKISELDDEDILLMEAFSARRSNTLEQPPEKDKNNAS